MTNVNGCTHVGDKSDKDLTIAFGTFKNINHFDWIKLCDLTKEPELTKDTIEYIRHKRLQYFTQQK